jgi:hypothetical protein
VSTSSRDRSRSLARVAAKAHADPGLAARIVAAAGAASTATSDGRNGHGLRSMSIRRRESVTQSNVVLLVFLLLLLVIEPFFPERKFGNAIFR